MEALSSPLMLAPKAPDLELFAALDPAGRASGTPLLMTDLFETVLEKGLSRIQFGQAIIISDVALRLVVGAWQALHLVAQDQVGAKCAGGLQKMGQALSFVIREGFDLQAHYQLVEPLVEALSDQSIVQGLLCLRPVTREQVFCRQHPGAHALEGAHLLLPCGAPTNEGKQAGQLLTRDATQTCPLFCRSYKLLSRSLKAS